MTGVHAEEVPFNLARGRSTYQSSHSVPHFLDAGHAVGEQFLNSRQLMVVFVSTFILKLLLNYDQEF